MALISAKKWEKERSLWLLIEGTLRGSRNGRASREAHWIQNGGRVGRREIVLEMEPEGLTNHSLLLPREGILSPTWILLPRMLGVSTGEGRFQCFLGFESISWFSFIRTSSFLRSGRGVAA